MEEILLVWMEEKKLGLSEKLRHTDPIDCSPQGCSVHGILHAKILEWVAISYSRRSSWPGLSCIAGRFFTIWATREAPNMRIRNPIFTLSPLLTYIIKSVMIQGLKCNNWKQCFKFMDIWKVLLHCPNLVPIYSSNNILYYLPALIIC